MKEALTKYWNQFTTWFGKLSTGGKIMFVLIALCVVSGQLIFALILAGFMRDITDGNSGILKQLFIEAIEKGILVEV